MQQTIFAITETWHIIQAQYFLESQNVRGQKELSNHFSKLERPILNVAGPLNKFLGAPGNPKEVGSNMTNN